MRSTRATSNCTVLKQSKNTVDQDQEDYVLLSYHFISIISSYLILHYYTNCLKGTSY